MGSTRQSSTFWVLSILDEFILNPQIRTDSETTPGTFQNINVENQEPKEDRSQDDPHPEVGPSVCQLNHSIESDADEAPQSCDFSAFQLRERKSRKKVDSQYSIITLSIESSIEEVRPDAFERVDFE